MSKRKIRSVYRRLIGRVTDWVEVVMTETAPAPAPTTSCGAPAR